MATNGLALSCVRNHNEVPVEVWRGDGGEEAGRVVRGILADGRWVRKGGEQKRYGGGVWEDGLIRLKGNVHFSRKVSVFGNTASPRTMPLLTARLLGK